MTRKVILDKLLAASYKDTQGIICRQDTRRIVLAAPSVPPEEDSFGSILFEDCPSDIIAVIRDAIDDELSSTCSTHGPFQSRYITLYLIDTTLIVRSQKFTRKRRRRNKGKGGKQEQQHTTEAETTAGKAAAAEAAARAQTQQQADDAIKLE